MVAASAIPSKFPLIFGFDATPGTNLTEPIPTATQTGPNIGRASLQVGFPPITFIDPAAGGTWPDGRDMNGILYMTSAVCQWTQAGGQWPYDSAFSSSITGYPSGALIQSATGAGLGWVSTADNNTTDPDTGGANWLPVVYVSSSNRTAAYVPATYNVGGNPNGALAGATGDEAYDFVHNQKFVCIVPGAIGTAVYKSVAAGSNPTNSVLLSGGSGPVIGVGPSSSAGTVLTSNGSGAAPSFQTGTHGGQSYLATGSYTFTVPANVYWLFAKVWGAGGGSSGGTGSSGAGGGYAEGWIQVVPGQVLTATVGAGGAPAISGATAGTGGSSSFGPFAATGGGGGGPGSPDGGGGIGGSYNANGGGGADLDGNLIMAWGGAAAGGGGAGGSINDIGQFISAKAPGGGGGANSFVPNGTPGADGGVSLTW